MSPPKKPPRPLGDRARCFEELPPTPRKPAMPDGDRDRDRDLERLREKKPSGSDLLRCACRAGDLSRMKTLSPPGRVLMTDRAGDFAR